MTNSIPSCHDNLLSHFQQHSTGIDADAYNLQQQQHHHQGANSDLTNQLIIQKLRDRKRRKMEKIHNIGADDNSAAAISSNHVNDYSHHNNRGTHPSLGPKNSYAGRIGSADAESHTNSGTIGAARSNSHSNHQSNQDLRNVLSQNNANHAEASRFRDRSEQQQSPLRRDQDSSNNPIGDVPSFHSDNETETSMGNHQQQPARTTSDDFIPIGRTPSGRDDVPVSSHNSEQRSVSSEQVPHQQYHHNNNSFHHIPEDSHGVSMEIPNHQFIHHSSIRLHQEILDFVAMISETEEEKVFRRHCIDFLCMFILEVDSTSSIFTYGSFESNTMIPGSDVDLFVESSKVKNKAAAKRFLQALHHLVKLNQIAFRQVKLILDANVPILKIQEKRTGMWFDIQAGFDEETDPRPVTEFTQQCIKQYPALRPLTLLLKYSLQQCGLSTPLTGGLTSYAVLLLVLHFLMTHSMNRDARIGEEMTLGRLLIDFLELYGQYMNFGRVRLRFSGERAYEPLSEEIMQQSPVPRLHVENPLRPNTFLNFSHADMSRIQYTFKIFFGFLTQGYRDDECILDRMIVPNEALDERRALVFEENNMKDEERQEF